MYEQKIIKIQLIKNMFLTFIVFTVLFIFFDIIIYYQTSNSLFKSIDEELLKNHEQFQAGQIPQNIKIEDKQEDKPNIDEERINNISNKRMNPRLVNIIRNSNGDIINQTSIGRFYDDYLTNIYFNKNNLNMIYNIKINNEYNYRGITYKTIQNDEEVYVQLLANVDGEMQTIQTVITTLLIGTVIIITISVLASYILSKRTLKPIIESYKKQTEFVQNASHELRTPLTIIQAKQELLLQEPNSKIIDKSEDINLTLKETRRLSKLIKELMTLARADSNEYILNKESVLIDKLIKEVTNPYIEFAKIENKTLKLDLKYNKESSIDRNKINQLLIILLDNSLKYTQENGNITLKTYYKDGKCNIELLDDGIGISDEGLKHVFDRFYREDKARSRETGGNGLGLSIAHTIVTAHGGSIKITHNEPKGTKVIVKI